MEWLFKLTHPSVLYTNASLSIKFILPSIIHVALSFVLLGICASDYLCPNVASIADSSYSTNIHPSHVRNTGTLMAVLLSWCNSSPDLFSNLMSWTAASSSTTAALSVGEVLGACGIILCVVEGSIFIIMSSTSISVTKYQKYSILKDLAFTFVAMSLMWYISIRNQVTVLNCMLMITVYIAYLVAKFSHKHSGVERLEENNDNNNTTRFIDRESQSVEENPFDSNDITQLRSGIKPSLISAMDYNSFLSILEQSTSNDGNLGQEQAELMSMHGENLILSFYESTRPSTEPTRYIPRMAPNLERPTQSAPDAFQPYRDDQESIPQNEHSIHTTSTVNINDRIGKRKNFKTLMIRILVPHLAKFSQKSNVDKVLSILTVPFVVLLQLSCPKVLELQEYDKLTSKYSISKLNLLILLSQAVLCPLIFFIILSSLIQKHFPFSVWLVPTACSVGLISLIWKFYKSIIEHNKFSLLETTMAEAEEKNSRRRKLEKLNDIIQISYLAIGILNSILYISIIANSLIEMMEIYQVITGISKAILGLTIFAWGNSISDLISNIAMCRFYLKVPHQEDFEHIQTIATKFFVISCTSCLGGVMLNSMFGIGISGFISMVFVHKDLNSWWFLRITSLQEPSEKDAHNYKFIVSCLTIMIQIAYLTIVFGGPPSVTKYVQNNRKVVGLSMCGLWGLATLFNVLVEIFN